MNALLHIIGPIGFDLSKKAVKRAGLDYWDRLNLTIHENTDEFIKWLGDREPWLVTKNGSVRYDLPEYKDEDVLIFGSEIQGLSEDLISLWSERTVYVPILGNIRNYNLANTVSVVLAHATLRSGLYD